MLRGVNTCSIAWMRFSRSCRSNHQASPKQTTATNNISERRLNWNQATFGRGRNFRAALGSGRNITRDSAALVGSGMAQEISTD